MAFPLLAIAALSALAPDAPASAPAPPEKPRLICREAEQNLGSHIRSSRRCQTAEQWQAEDAARERAPLSLTVTEGQQDGHAAQKPR